LHVINAPPQQPIRIRTLQKVFTACVDVLLDVPNLFFRLFLFFDALTADGLKDTDQPV